MGNNSFAPILGYGTAIISLNGKRILIHNQLHVPALLNPLYCIRAHQQRQDGCGFLGLYGMGMYVFFPSFILEVDTTVDCHLSYESLGRLASLSSFNYVQPVTPQHLASKTTTLPSAPARIEPDDNELIAPTFAAHWPKKPPSLPPLDIDLSLIPTSKYLVKLKDMSQEELICCFYEM
jgi:hypothetical protein